MDHFEKEKEIAGKGKYEDIVETLRKTGAFSSCVDAVRKECGSRLSLDYFSMTDHDFEMLTVLFLYDHETALHSIRTFELAYDIITRRFEYEDRTIVFEDLLSGSSVRTEQFLRAALFHDIGKVIIPREVLHNSLDDEEVLLKMFPEDGLQEKSSEHKKALLQSLYKKGIRPIDVVPLREIFSDENTEVLCDLEKRGFHNGATLKDVIRTHEPESERILSLLGYEIESEIAGRHHNYAKESHPHILRDSSHEIAVADILRLADVTDALQSARWYKKPLSTIEILFVLANDADIGKIDSFLSTLWIRVRYNDLKHSPEWKNIVDNPARAEELRFIESFLKKEFLSP